jgi:hypothetical protein
MAVGVITLIAGIVAGGGAASAAPRASHAAGYVTGAARPWSPPEGDRREALTALRGKQGVLCSGECCLGVTARGRGSGDEAPASERTGGFFCRLRSVGRARREPG